MWGIDGKHAITTKTVEVTCSVLTLAAPFPWLCKSGVNHLEQFAACPPVVIGNIFQLEIHVDSFSLACYGMKHVTYLRLKTTTQSCSDSRMWGSVSQFRLFYSFFCSICYRIWEYTWRSVLIWLNRTTSTWRAVVLKVDCSHKSLSKILNIRRRLI